MSRFPISYITFTLPISIARVAETYGFPVPVYAFIFSAVCFLLLGAYFLTYHSFSFHTLSIQVLSSQYFISLSATRCSILRAVLAVIQPYMEALERSLGRKASTLRRRSVRRLSANLHFIPGRRRRRQESGFPRRHIMAPMKRRAALLLSSLMRRQETEMIEGLPIMIAILHRIEFLMA